MTYFDLYELSHKLMAINGPGAEVDISVLIRFQQEEGGTVSVHTGGTVNRKDSLDDGRLIVEMPVIPQLNAQCSVSKCIN